MIRGRVVGALAVEAGDSAATDAHEPHDQMPLPTLDRRVSFYLRAVHGDRDFTNQEYSRARESILNAMAADIAARSNARSPVGTSLPTELPEGLRALAGAPLEIAAFQSSYESRTVRPSAGDTDFGEHQASEHEASDQAVCSVTKPRGALDHRVEHRLNIGGRARDHTQNLTGGSLLIQGFGEFAVAGFEFLRDAAQLFFELAQFGSLRILFLLYCPKPSHQSSPKSILRELSLG